MGPLKHGGLALATSIAALFNVILLIHLLRKRLGLMEGRKILSSTIKLSFASGFMAIAVYIFNGIFLDPAAALMSKLLVISADIGIGVILYVFISRLIQNEELSFLIKFARERGKNSIA